MYKVLVLISTYNGETYIEEQLESLLKQDINIDILVRDDGSTDRTTEILQRYKEQGLLNWVQGNNIGWAKSFIELILQAPTADYYAFCDQDDIWLPNKLSVAISKLESIDDNIKLYCSNLTTYKNGKAYSLVKPLNLDYSKYLSLISCINYGCTCVCNKGLIDIIKANPPKIVFAHDFWLYQTAMFCGTVFYDNQSYILYRQHSNNQVGGTKTFRQRLIKRIDRLKTLGQQHERELMAKELLNCYSHLLSEEDIQTIKVISEYRKNLIKRISLLFDNRFTYKNFERDFFFKIRILLGHI